MFLKPHLERQAVTPQPPVLCFIFIFLYFTFSKAIGLMLRVIVQSFQAVVGPWWCAEWLWCHKNILWVQGFMELRLRWHHYGTLRSVFCVEWHCPWRTTCHGEEILRTGGKTREDGRYCSQGSLFQKKCLPPDFTFFFFLWSSVETMPEPGLLMWRMPLSPAPVLVQEVLFIPCMWIVSHANHSSIIQQSTLPLDQAH